MLSVVKRLMTGKDDDAAALQQQIVALKTEGAEASAEIDRLKRERTQAASYDEARELDDRINRQIWITQHCAAEIPELELQLGAVRAAAQAAALARHKAALIGLYPRFKAAILAAVEAQHEVIAAREAACKDLGEGVVSRHLPNLAFAGFLMKDLVAIWQTENDRVFSELSRKPKPAAMAAPVRAALPAPAKSKAKPAVAAPAPRPPRKMRLDPFPTDDQHALVVFLNSGVDLQDGSVAAIGDQIALPAEQARQLVLRGLQSTSRRKPVAESARLEQTGSCGSTPVFAEGGTVTFAAGGTYALLSAEATALIAAGFATLA
jgi:hypothetical protein